MLEITSSFDDEFLVLKSALKDLLFCTTWPLSLDRIHMIKAAEGYSNSLVRSGFAADGYM